MIARSEVLENPAIGHWIRFLVRSADSGGELVRIEAGFRPGGSVGVPHVHPAQEERFEVRSGRLRIRLGRDERTLGAGEAVTIPPGVPHGVWNAGDTDAVATVDVRPAGRIDEALETIFALARDGKVNRKGMPNPLRGALIAREYGTYMARPPVWVQRAAVAVIAPLARALGYRARYEGRGAPGERGP